MTALARARSDESIVPGEFRLSQRAFDRIAAMLYADSGITLNQSKVSLVNSRLAKRLRVLGLPDFDAYCARLESDPDERAAMLSALTTNVTRFFREPHHFEHLTQFVLPRLAEHARRGGRVRLWSAGCSAGHEPYTLAMTLLEALPEADRLDVLILATDIDPNIVQRAREALYSAEDIEPVAPAMRGRHLVRAGDGWTCGPQVRNLVRFGVLNLLQPWPMKGEFDVIFCRNVAIYFDEPTQAALFANFANRLTGEGRLYIGHSERTSTPELVSDGLTIYRRAT